MSTKFPVKVEIARWNCLSGNAKNLIHSLGHWDKKSERSMSQLHLQNQQSPAKSMKNILIELGYNVVDLPRDMDYEQLTTLVTKLRLPMLLSLDLDFGEASYGHVIGVCPHKSDDGVKTFRIIDGAHPDMCPFEYTLKNLSWCCGGDRMFQRTSWAIAFFPGVRRTKDIAYDWKERFKTKEDIQKSGVSVCFNSSRRCNLQKHVSELNVLDKSREEYCAMVKIVIKSVGRMSLRLPEDNQVLN